MSSIGNYSLPYPKIQPPPKPPQPNANDIDIAGPGGTNIEVLGVEGVGTESPTATFNVEGQGTGTVKVSGINIPPGGQLHVRLKTNGNTLPNVTITWTFNGKPVPGVPQTQHDHAAAPPPASGTEGESAVMLLGVLEELVRLLKERVPLSGLPSSEGSEGRY